MRKLEGSPHYQVPNLGQLSWKPLETLLSSSASCLKPEAEAAAPGDIAGRGLAGTKAQAPLLGRAIFTVFPS